MDGTTLGGGNITVVTRVGETVRRAMGPWSSAVHDLLRHLEARGFDGAPRLLGVDGNGREILTFITGEVGNYPLAPFMWSDESLGEAARLLRRFHDTTIGYVAPSGAVWQFVYPDSRRHEVICHNDFAPYNVVFVDERPTAIIDFDTAGPGPQIWDVAYAVYRFVPLAADAGWPTAELGRLATRQRRLRLFCDAYGLDQHQRHELPATTARRLDILSTLIVERAATGDAAYQRAIDEGHLALYRRDAAFVRQHGATLERDLR